jgi:hypothetical protein
VNEKLKRRLARIEAEAGLHDGPRELTLHVTEVEAEPGSPLLKPAGMHSSRTRERESQTDLAVVVVKVRTSDDIRSEVETSLLVH